jgi:dienelactone hydrolase
VVLEMARRGIDLKGVASFHGNLSTQTKVEPGSIKAKILVLHGDDDVLIPQEQVAAFKSEMQNAGADIKFIGWRAARIHQPGSNRERREIRPAAGLQRGCRHGKLERAEAIP